MLNIIITILALGVIVTIHELGHFTAARLFGVRIEKFSIGFGSPILKFERNGTEYCISWIPLGGYVKMYGENPEDEIQDQEGAFQHKAWWNRVIIAFSGPFANLLLAILLFFVAFALPNKMEDMRPVVYQAPGISSTIFAAGDSISAVNGSAVIGWYQAMSLLSRDRDNSVQISRAGTEMSIPIPAAIVDSIIIHVKPVVSTVVGAVNPGLPAWKAGLKDLDVILTVDSMPVSNWYDMRDQIVNTSRDSVNLLIRRDNALLRKTMPLQENLMSDSERIIGISQYFPIRYAMQRTIPEAATNSIYGVSNFIVLNYYGLYKLILKPEQLKSNLGGPVMMATISQQAGKKGVVYLILFFGSISLLLMIMNLLPIPILDGGLIFFCFIEAIRRKPLSLKIQGILQRVGFAMLMLLMVYAFYADISTLLIRSFSNH
ncbi:MAG: RIP metalloprotease RseP [Candidatus Cloacimonetes bacterium HGW-Cloacimonetes-1]|nr:MAG: RIP metalloprotease RseP [Candidatus Cloacimonetes bacterium HGW-Cloacimonetes-1]